MSWIDELRQASFRGVPFAVKAAEARIGRRQVVHEYPFRDVPYIEDLGRATRRISFFGFIVANDLIFDTDDVIQLREQLMAAAEKAGPGELVHPTLGRLKVSLVELSVAERWEDGGYFELGFAFIESGQRLFPSNDISTKDAVHDAADNADAAASSDFGTRAFADLKQGAATVGAAVQTAALFAHEGQRLANDATNIFHAVSKLPGSFGRYFGGRNKGGFTTGQVGAGGGGITTLISQSTIARNNVATASSLLSSSASNLGL